MQLNLFNNPTMTIALPLVELQNCTADVKKKLFNEVVYDPDYKLAYLLHLKKIFKHFYFRFLISYIVNRSDLIM